MPASTAHAVTSAEAKMFCKNKCQYDYRDNCYENCLQEQTQGEVTEEEKTVTWDDLAKQAEEFFNAKDYEQAARVYNELVKMDPLAAIAFYNLGICYENTGQYDLAVQNYQKYLDLKPYAEDRPEVESWIRRLKMNPEQEKQRYQTFTIASSPAGKIKLRIIQQNDVRLRVDVVSPEPFMYKIVERVDPPSVSLRAYVNGYVPTREVIPVWRGGVKEILLHYEQDEQENDKRSYLLITVRLEKEPRNPEPFSGFTDGYINYDAVDNQNYTFDMSDDERRFSFVFDIHLKRDSSFLEKVDIQQVQLKDICEAIARFSHKSCMLDYRLRRLWEQQDRAITYSTEKVFIENVLDYFANQFNFRWVETDKFYILLSEQGFEWLAQNGEFYDLRPGERIDKSTTVLDPVTFDQKKFWDVLDYFNNWHYISFKESVIWRLKDSAAGGEGIIPSGVLQGGPTFEEFLTAMCAANSLFWFRVWDAYFLTDRIDRIGKFVELAGLGDWHGVIPVQQPARFGFDDFDLPEKARYYFRWALIYINNKQGAWALRELEKAIDRAPESADVYFYSGIACMLDNHNELAIRAFQRAVRMNPNHTMARYMLARSYSFYNDLRDAIEQYKTALAQQPDFAPAARELGIIYMQRGLLKDSIEYLQRGIMTMPADMEAQYELARALYFNGDYEKSWDHLTIARPTEYVKLSLPQVQRRLILEFGQQWHREWYDNRPGAPTGYPRSPFDFQGWYFNKPDWKAYEPGYYRDDSKWYRAYPQMNYYPYYDEDRNKEGVQPSLKSGKPQK